MRLASGVRRRTRRDWRVRIKGRQHRWELGMRGGSEEEGKGDVCVDTFHFYGGGGHGVTRKEGRVAVTEDAVVLIYAYYR